jgi:CheY-like chemotaxis protein
MTNWFTQRRPAAPTTGPLTILIVDDEAPVREFLRRALEMVGYVTHVASGAIEALRAAAALERVDILVTDLMMPGIRGDELARRLRLKDPDLKVLYVTGFSDDLFEARRGLWNNEAFLDKPCCVNGLLEAVALLTSGHTDQRAR